MNWQKLIGVLSEEKAIYDELIELAAVKKDAINQKEVEQLDAVVRREQGAVMRLGHWEKQRLACMETPKDHPGSPTLLFFADTAPPAEGEKLRALHGELSERIKTMQKLNAENKTLVEARLEYVHFVMDALGEDQMTGVYGAKGYDPPESGASIKILDKKV